MTDDNFKMPTEKEIAALVAASEAAAEETQKAIQGLGRSLSLAALYLSKAIEAGRLLEQAAIEAGISKGGSFAQQDTENKRPNARRKKRKPGN